MVSQLVEKFIKYFVKMKPRPVDFHQLSQQGVSSTLFHFNKILDELFDQLGDHFSGYCLNFDQVFLLKIRGPNKQDTCLANEDPCFISSILFNR